MTHCRTIPNIFRAGASHHFSNKWGKSSGEGGRGGGGGWSFISQGEKKKISVALKERRSKKGWKGYPLAGPPFSLHADAIFLRRSLTPNFPQAIKRNFLLLFSFLFYTHASVSPPLNSSNPQIKSLNCTLSYAVRRKGKGEKRKGKSGNLTPQQQIKGGGTAYKSPTLPFFSFLLAPKSDSLI